MAPTNSPTIAPTERVVGDAQLAEELGQRRALGAALDEVRHRVQADVEGPLVAVVVLGRQMALVALVALVALGERPVTAFRA